MYITIIKIKNHKKKNNQSLFQIYKILFFRKYNYMCKIFPKIYLKFDLKCFQGSIIVLSSNK